MTVTISKLVVPLTLIPFLAVQAGHASMDVVQKEISVSRALAGRILVQRTDAPANGATVELCSPDWKTVLTSTKADEMGYFSLERPAKGKVFYIRVSAPGMDIYELRVRINKRATEELRIHLSVAT
jgi:hypothetical protein